MESLQRRSGGEWRTLFDQRYMSSVHPYGSSVWGKKEMVCPLVEDENVVSMYEGGKQSTLGRAPGWRIGHGGSVDKAVRQ